MIIANRRCFQAGATTVLLLLLAGCATVEPPGAKVLLWPEPPLTPRVKFVGLLRSQDDLGRSAGELFTEALLGRKKLPDSLERPMGLAVSRDGTRLYVTDYASASVYVFDFERRRASRFGDERHGFKYPYGVAVDDRDNVYVADSGSKLVRVFDRDGKFLRDIVHDLLERPTGIAIDSIRRRIYVIDSSYLKSHNHMLHALDMDNGGECIRHFGGRGGGAKEFFFPTNVAVDALGNVYVTDTFNSRVQVFDHEGNHLKTIGERGDAFGMFDKPKGVALDAFGNVYVVDSGWSNVQIFNQRGQVLLFFGGRGGYPGLLTNPTGITIDRNNRIYVADAFNRRVVIYELINTKAEDSFVAVPPSAEKGGKPASTSGRRKP